MEFEGKVAFITGGAQGLGRAFTEALLERGSKVFFGDVNPELSASTAKELAERFGKENVKFSTFDVRDHKSFEAAFNGAVSEFGHVDIMVNNAGILHEFDWERMIQINLVAVIMGTKLATEHMRRDKGGRGGRIINISSAAGLVEVPSVPVYCGCKHAVRSFTSSMALSPNIEETGIEYGILCPGPTDTPLTRTTNASTVHFEPLIKARWDALMMPVSKAKAAFLQLVQLEKMNGAILSVWKEDNKFVKMATIESRL